MPTINVYISEDLKAEMDEAQGYVPNWSAVCQAAIKQEILTKRINSMADKDADAIAERVRGTKSRKHQAGYDAGKEFAAELATIDDFEYFSGDEFEKAKTWVEQDNKTARDLVAQIEKDTEWDLSDFAENETITLRWISGFAEAVTDVWSQIRFKVGGLAA